MDVRNVAQKAPEDAMPVLAHATENAAVGVPVEKVDLAKWIMTLRDAEYCNCAPGEHKACGVSKAADGRPMSICVEFVGGQLMIQHYVAEIMTPSFCRMKSLSDSFADGKWSTVDVTWEVTVVPAADGTCTFTNSITSRATPEGLRDLEAAGVTVEQAASQRTKGISDHNKRETPQFAASVERLARASEAA